MESKEEKNEPGFIRVPLVIVTDSTYINDEVVWYRNPFKNFLLKIKHLFFKPRYLSVINKMKLKNIDASKYTTIKIFNKEKTEIKDTDVISRKL